MISGTMVAMPNNSPTYAGIHCECLGNSGKCPRLLWARFPAVRTLRGKFVSSDCAVKSGIATWEQLSVAWLELIDSGALPGKTRSPSSKKKKTKLAPIPEPDLETDSEPQPKRQRKKDASAPTGKREKKTVSEVAHAALTEERGIVHDSASALEEALFENAPTSVKKKRRRKQKTHGNG